MNIIIEKCPWCRGSGYELAEQGSSLAYRCPDCNGAGEIQRCGDCGEIIDGDYCKNCYGECECGEIIEKKDLENGLCPECMALMEQCNAN